MRVTPDELRLSCEAIEAAGHELSGTANRALQDITHYIDYRPPGSLVMVPMDPQPPGWVDKITINQDGNLAMSGFDLGRSPSVHDKPFVECPYQPGHVLLCREFQFVAQRWQVRDSRRVLSVKTKQLKDVTEEEAIAAGFSGCEMFVAPEEEAEDSLTSRDGTTPESWYWLINTEPINVTT